MAVFWRVVDIPIAAMSNRIPWESVVMSKTVMASLSRNSPGKEKFFTVAISILIVSLPAGTSRLLVPVHIAKHLFCMKRLLVAGIRPYCAGCANTDSKTPKLPEFKQPVIRVAATQLHIRPAWLKLNQ